MDKYLIKKKTIISYMLCVLILWTHIASFNQYDNWPEWQWTFYYTIKSLTAPSVPLYFIISAALFYRDYTNKLYLQKIKRRVFTLFIPLILWNTLHMLFYEALAHISVLKDYVGRSEKIHSLRDVFLGIIYYDQFNGPFWFVSALIVMSLAAPVVDFLMKNRVVALLVICFFSWICSTKLVLMFPSFYYNRAWIVYYLVGVWIGKHGWGWFQKRQKRNVIIVAFVGFVLMWLWGLQTWFPINFYLGIARGIVFAISLWICYDGIEKKIKERRLFKHSFLVFAMHMDVNSVVSKIAFLFLPKDWRAVIPNFIITTVGTLLFIEIIAIVLERYLPRTYKILTGNR